VPLATAVRGLVVLCLKRRPGASVDDRSLPSDGLARGAEVLAWEATSFDPMGVLLLYDVLAAGGSRRPARNRSLQPER